MSSTQGWQNQPWCNDQHTEYPSAKEGRGIANVCVLVTELSQIFSFRQVVLRASCFHASVDAGIARLYEDAELLMQV
ncbi:unnamed protein product [Urochloa humidicola]